MQVPLPESSLTHVADSRCGSGSSRHREAAGRSGRVVHRAHFRTSSPMNKGSRSSRACGYRGKPCSACSEAQFCPPALWVDTVDEPASLWMRRSSAQPVHRGGPVLPSCIPSFPTFLPRHAGNFDVTAFTRAGDLACFVAEQWTTVWKDCAQQPSPCGRPVDNDRRPDRSRPTCTVCGHRACTDPQPSDLPGPPPATARCGQNLDNSQVPRVWTAGFPHRCGEAASRGTESNSTRRHVRRRAPAGDVSDGRPSPS